MGAHPVINTIMDAEKNYKDSGTEMCMTHIHIFLILMQAKFLKVKSNEMFHILESVFKRVAFFPFLPSFVLSLSLPFSVSIRQSFVKFPVH